MHGQYGAEPGGSPVERLIPAEESVMADRKYRIASIPGDGIGKEVVPEGLRVVEAAAGGSALS